MVLRLRDKIFLGLLVIVLVLVLVNKITGKKQDQPLSEYGNPLVNLQVTDKTIQAEVVNTADKMAQGLSDRESLGQNQGMLFVHNYPGKYEYVMRGMKFPLDFVFINGNRIVDIAKDVPTDFSGKIIGEVEYDKVLELNAGWTEKNGIGLGDEVKIVNSK